MTDSNSSPVNKRQHARYSCVGIELLYSPLNEGIVSNVAESFFQATSHDISLAGIAFDIKSKLQIDDQLLVFVKSPDGLTEVLKTEVRWCKPINDSRFRVGVAITDVVKQEDISSQGIVIDQLDNADGVPNQARLVCPACKQRSWFELVGKQGGVPHPTLLPLYNCSHCNTTRTIPSLLSFNREFITGD